MKPESPLKVVSLLFALPLLHSNICHARPKSWLEVIKLFDKCYGGPGMDEIADYTTPQFRNNKPKSVWVVHTWKTLTDIEYEGPTTCIIHSTVNADKAIVVVEAKIKQVAGEATQKEIHSLVKAGARWLIDELVVTKGETDLHTIQL